MRRLGSAILAATSASMALASPQVSTAGGDWSNIPLIKTQGSLRISTEAIDQIEAAAAGPCARSGLSKKHVELTMPFLVKFSSQGAVERVVVREMQCAAIEQVIGGAVLQLAKAGEYRPTGENIEGWYRGEIALSLQ
ncbi:hypothetical protein [Sphingomonas xanthus]|uniref:Uncharacterized protein n=1 Tax=Sphingomonas xanthus TaxID=2594473 RepID=A0A516IPW3_9SPHN|nr:hypothetical protein [Sphingomonas xanthus]QDP18804.1 hypothetical protein FMM02_01820 [Sphingomonas xanthus]